MKPNYINDNLKEVPLQELKKILNELALKHDKERKEQAEAIHRALRDGFRCVPRNH